MKKVEVRYFASLREAVGRERESVVLDDAAADVEILLETLARERGEAWAATLADPGVRVAVNAELVARDTPLADGDEVAFLPPVTGG